MTIQQRLSGTAYPLRLTAAEFLAVADAGLFSEFARTELIEGEVWTANAVHRWHARVQPYLSAAIIEGLRAAGLDLVVYTNGSVLMSDDSVPEPDISICEDEPLRREPIGLSATRIAIELSDASRNMDLVRKAALYARCGVPEYWVADREEQVLVQHSLPGSAGYQSVVDVKFGEAVRSATLKGLVVETVSLIG